MANIEVKVPDIGDFKDVPVIEILVKPGETVKAEQSLITLESDKATMDVPSPADGVVGEILVKLGDKLSMGRPVLTLAPVAGVVDPGKPASATPATTSAPPVAGVADPGQPTSTTPATTPTPARTPAIADFSGVNAGPAVRRLARELGLEALASYSEVKNVFVSTVD